MPKKARPRPEAIPASGWVRGTPGLKRRLERIERELTVFEAKRKLAAKAQAERNRLRSTTPDAGDYYKDWRTYAGMFAVMEKFLHGLKGKRILHLAAGPGIAIKFLRKKKKAEAYGLDLNPEMVGFSKKIGNPVPVVADASASPFPTGSMHAVFACNFLTPEYLRDKTGWETAEKTFREAHRVLKPGGLLFVQNFDGSPPDHYASSAERAGFRKIFRGFPRDDIQTREISVWKKGGSLDPKKDKGDLLAGRH